jgi:E-phenylitaconyl-CoA hydratase
MTAESKETITYEKRHGVAEVTLNRPDRHNALNLKMQEELSEVWRDFDDDDNLRVAILTGAGDKSFCSGADVKGWVATDGPRRGKSLDRMGYENLGKFTPFRSRTWKPVICAVNGMCVGAGLHFIHDSDIIIASENATFFDTHLAVGQVFAGEPIGLSRRLPLGIVMGMALLGKNFRLTAQRAYDLGLVLEVVPQETLMERAREMADVILQQAPIATRISKKAIYSGLNLGLQDAYELGSYMLQMAWGSDEGIEGPRAFAEHRPPSWVSEQAEPTE